MALAAYMPYYNTLLICFHNMSILDVLFQAQSHLVFSQIKPEVFYFYLIQQKLIRINSAKHSLLSKIACVFTTGYVKHNVFKCFLNLPPVLHFYNGEFVRI